MLWAWKWANPCCWAMRACGSARSSSVSPTVVAASSVSRRASCSIKPTLRPPVLFSRAAAAPTAWPWPVRTGLSRLTSRGLRKYLIKTMCGACALSHWTAAGRRCARRWTVLRNSSTWSACWRRYSVRWPWPSCRVALRPNTWTTAPCCACWVNHSAPLRWPTALSLYWWVCLPAPWAWPWGLRCITSLSCYWPVWSRRRCRPRRSGRWLLAWAWA